MAFNVSYAADDSAISSNKVSDFINLCISADNQRSIEAIQTHLASNATIKITDPHTRTVSTYSRDEYLQIMIGMWKKSLEYKLTVQSYSIRGNTIILRVNQYSRQAAGSVSRNGTETMELNEYDGRLTISSMDIIPDKEAEYIPNNRLQATSHQGAPSPEP